ncbi:beta-lactamase/transpeptidase-like protein [Tothia fuscella]|uniref:Beta-lactamase/transpeptidase-like protein n=1 Tax=Tothia fuscella TaxID=1048955 RepID=A0A9P4NDY7_9PEZI|nr:beta-lactamase/transpeptidase-like protein [Tothia fuscella]
MDSIDEKIEDIRAICGAVSVSYGILHHGEVIRTRSLGYRNTEKHLSADSDTIYAIGSLSKSFLAASVGILVSAGKLEWKTPIKDYISEFDPVHDSNIGRFANLVDILCHSTGLADHDLLQGGPSCQFQNSNEDSIRIINNLPAKAGGQPRFRRWWKYNNSVSSLASVTIERVSGTSCYADFLRENLLELLGLARTLAHQSLIMTDTNMAMPYARLQDGSHCSLQLPIMPENSSALSCLGLWSSVNDMLSFAKHTLDAERSENSAFSSDSVLKEMQTIRKGFHKQPSRDDFQKSCSYGMGWLRVTTPSAHLGLLSPNDNVQKSGLDLPFILGQRSTSLDVVMHNGRVPGYDSVLLTVPSSETAIVVMTNGSTDGGASDWIGRILLQEVLRLQPKVDIVSLARQEAQLSRTWFQDHVQTPLGTERFGLDSSLQQSDVCNFVGEYRNEQFGVSLYIKLAGSVISVSFNANEKLYALTLCRPDVYTFMPSTRDQWLRDSMIDCFDYRTSLLHFCRSADDSVEGFRWKWDGEEEVSWFSKQIVTT